MCFSNMLCVLQRFKLEQASQADPLTLLEDITQNGISQDICVNDLGMHVPK
jgi:4-diphosphocytidyl-2-C-methyl-D-erythritol kinase